MSTKEDLNATIPMIFTVESDSESDSNTSEEGTYYGSDFTRSISQEKSSSPEVIREIINLVSDNEDSVQEIEQPTKRTRLPNSTEIRDTPTSSIQDNPFLMNQKLDHEVHLLVLELLHQMIQNIVPEK